MTVRLWHWLAALALSAAVLAPVKAQGILARLQLARTKPSETGETAAVQDTLAQQRGDLSQRITEAQRKIDAARANLAAGESVSEELSQELELLKQLDSVLAQQQAAEARREELQAGIADLETRLADLRQRGPTEPRPYSFLLLERLRDELAAENSRADAVRLTVDAAVEAHARAKATFEEKERKRRRAREAAEQNKDPQLQPRLAAAESMAQLDSRLGAEMLRLREMELANERLAEQFFQRNLPYLRERLQWIAVDARFTQQDLQDQLLELDKQEDDMRRAIDAAQTNLQYLERVWFEARSRLEAAAEPTPAMTEELAARRGARQVQQQRILMGNQQLQRINEMRTMWQIRFHVVGDTASPGELEAWKVEVARRLEAADRDARLMRLRMEEIRHDMAILDTKFQDGKQVPPDAVRWVRDQRDQHQRLIQFYGQQLLGIEAARRLAQKLCDEIAGHLPAQSDSYWALFVAAVKAVWDYELMVLEDRPITVRKLFVGLVLLVLGIVLSDRLSRFIGRRLLPRLSVHPSAAAAFQSLAFYALIAVVLLSALHLINVPLAALTIVGGALALGVGFGSQNIVNNFISGLILLAERPVRVGDIVEVDGMTGVVVHIGARSTRVRTGQNLEIVVPNSKFLENSVTNWTLSDAMIRCCVSVGVTYGSPTREVTRLLKRAADEHGLVLDHPEPFVWFVDFGESCLQFELHFWVQMRMVNERRRIESDIRYLIDNLFRDAGIVMAFPQRDVHLNVSKPIAVHLEEPASSALKLAQVDQA